jgi:hypothetical protein
VSAAPTAAAARAAERAVALPVVVSTAIDDETVTVTATYERRSTGLIGRLIGPIEHHAEVTMALEPP